MIELRWVYWENVGAQELQYRFVTPNVDASGALCPPGEMSEWKPVQFVNGQTLVEPDGPGKKTLS